MKQRNLLLILVLAIVTISSAFAAKPKAKHVIWIGLDGWGAYRVEKAEMPVTKQFMKDGAYTLNVYGSRSGDSRIYRMGL